MAKAAAINELTYEQAFQELENIVKELEGEVGNLDESLKLFERGQALAKHCAQLLEKAELRVQALNDDGDLTDLD
jgi:exodeoxyribonuclease VII small subunit